MTQADSLTDPDKQSPSKQSSGKKSLLQKLLRPQSTKGKILDSTVWTLGERVGTLAVSWTVSIFVANYLGSHQFGELSYAIALVSLFSTLVSAGLAGLVVKDLVRKPEQRDQILGTVFSIRLAGALLSILVLGMLTLFVGIGGAQNKALTMVIAIGMCFKAMDVVDFWFQSQTRLRYSSIANIGSTLVGAIAKIFLVATDAPLIWFGWAIAIESLATSALLMVMFQRTAGKVRLWRPSLATAKSYLGKSWPLVLSGIANAINLRIDQVLLGSLAGASAVGTYAVAARLSEVWYFVPTAIGAAVFPALVKTKEKGDGPYREKLRLLYGMFAWGAAGVAIVITLISEPLINGLYSEDFAGAADVLVIHVWTAPFLFMSVIFSKWLIIEDMLLSSLIRHGFGAILNVVLNFVLIPHHGPVGSAIATLVSYAAATYLACFLTRRTWPAAWDMTRALFAPVELAVIGIRKLRTRS